MLRWAKSAVGSIILAHSKAVAKEMSLLELNLFHQLQKRAAQETVDYIETNLPDAVALRDSEELFRYALPKLNSGGMILEFGVFKGRTINKLALHAKDRTVYGFDSFEGLPEDWTGWKHPAGYYSLGGALPRVRDNVRLVKGWFDKTLPKFLADHPGQAADLIHIHCDLYSSTKTVFEHLSPRLRKNTYVVFHEYFGLHGWRKHEFRAWQEFVKARDVRYSYLAYSSGEAGQVLIRVDAIGAPR